MVISSFSYCFSAWTARYRYDAWGSERAVDGATSGNTYTYTSRRKDADLGLLYYRARYYDPTVGRFISQDAYTRGPDDPRVSYENNLFAAMHGEATLYTAFLKPHEFNRYIYCANNPIRFTDPLGLDAFDNIADFAAGVGDALSFGLTRVVRQIAGTDYIHSEGVYNAGVITGTVADVAVGAGLAKRAIKKAGTEVVERAMSKAELKATEGTGFLRGGKIGTSENPHFVSDVINSTSTRARQRLALPQEPQVKVRMEVRKGLFSRPSRVAPKHNMPGGGTERMGLGKIPVKILKKINY